MPTVNIASLEKDIKTTRDQLKIMKEALYLIRKQEKENRPFSQTKFGSFYYRALRAAAFPFVKLYKNAETNLSNPLKVQSDKLLSKSKKLLEKSRMLNREEHEDKSDWMSVKLAEHTIEIEEFVEANHLFMHIHETCINKLRSEIKRLRPPNTKQTQQG